MVFIHSEFFVVVKVICTLIGDALEGNGKATKPTDLQLPLDTILAAVSVLGLGCVVFCHHLHKLAREG